MADPAFYGMIPAGTLPASRAIVVFRPTWNNGPYAFTYRVELFNERWFDALYPIHFYFNLHVHDLPFV